MDKIATSNGSTSSSHLRSVLSGFFGERQRIGAIEGLGDGNINDTYLVTLDRRPSVVLQRLNGSVFPDPACVADNVALVGAYLGAQLSVNKAGCRTCRFIETLHSLEGSNYVKDQRGDVWRCLSYIDNGVVHPQAGDPQQAHEAGKVLGCFHALLEDFDTSLLCDPLPGFHDWESYKEYYLASNSSTRRLRGPESDYCRKVIEERLDTPPLEEIAGPGLTSNRAVHGDPKCDNFLVNKATGTGVSLIDLDTVSSGLLAMDLGDCLRSFCNPAGEKATSKVSFDVEVAARLLAGYRLITPLNKVDRYLVYHGVRLLTLELGLRFFTDYLNGDRYFKVTQPGDNLLRARVQLDLLLSIEEQRAALEQAAGCGSS